MKLTLKIKLLPDKQQAQSLLDTLKEANTACNGISEIAFTKRLFNQFGLHREAYHMIRGTFNLSAQMVIRCISKVADAYKIDKKIKRDFRPLGGIAYDNRILSYKPGKLASIWSVNGRLTIPFICHNEKYIPFIKGEADLVFKKGKFYLFQVIEIADTEIEDVENFIGVDFGITNIITTSDGVQHTAENINAYREKKQKIRSSIQRKGTRSSKRLLKRLSGREKTTATIINHTISKHLVQSAKAANCGISIEDLTNIRFTSRRGIRNKKFRTKLGRWNFGQLRRFIAYKSRLSGVPLAIVNPAYTSQTCHKCHHIGKRQNKVFKCENQHCTVDVIDADFNAAKNISVLGAAISQPERCDMYSCSVHY